MADRYLHLGSVGERTWRCCNEGPMGNVSFTCVMSFGHARHAQGWSLGLQGHSLSYAQSYHSAFLYLARYAVDACHLHWYSQNYSTSPAGFQGLRPGPSTV